MPSIYLVKDTPAGQVEVRDTTYDLTTHNPESAYKKAQALLREHPDEYSLVVAEVALTEALAV